VNLVGRASVNAGVMRQLVHAMNLIVYHIASGQAFFSGVILLVIAVLASTSTRRIVNRMTVIVFLVGVIAIALSSTPLPYWIYAIAIVLTLAWIASRFRVSLRRWAPYATIAVWLIAAAVEIPYHLTQKLNPAADYSMTVIGDSVSAGVGANERSETWPSIIGREHRIQVQDISHVGETVASALTRAKSNVIAGSVVIIELGGNDILGSTTSLQFANNLDDLLRYLTVNNRQIIMFEMPLPPFCNAYGRAQRVTAAKYKVTLIPKHIFLSVIAGNDFTLDSIHLSKSGHKFMADCVWHLVKTAFPGEKAA